MEALLIYLSKASGILAIFYSAYQLFLKKETFFYINRHFLIVGILTALALPFVTITNYVDITALPLNYTNGESSLTSVAATTSDFNLIDLIFAIYILGLGIFTTKFIIQILSLYKLVKSNKSVKKGKFYYVEIQNNIAPFSFFKYIFYNPDLFSQSELSAILKHEKAHSSQWHSLDVLFSHFITIITWMNPFSWLYQTNIKQNLEFLADESATKVVPSIKNYQYTLLKVSGNQFYTPIVNNFFNSLTRLNVLGRTFLFTAQYGQVKKRIVMLNKSKSNKRNILKIAVILPALAVFLVSFNTKDVYVPIDSNIGVQLNADLSSQIIEIIIDKNTSNKELNDMKKDLAKKGVDFSYTVVHNAKNEIIDISVDFVTTKNDGKKISSSSSFSNGDEGIDPIHIIYDEEANSISMGSDKGIHIDVNEDTEKTIWVHADHDGDENKTVEITKKNGKETIKVNGKKLSRKEFEAMKEKDGIHEKHIEIKKSKGDTEKNVFIMKMLDDDDEDIIEVEEGKEMFIINTDSDEIPLFIIDGQESNEKDMKKLDPLDIKSMNVLKGEMAEKKYGKKGKNGVVEITTKKK